MIALNGFENDACVPTVDFQYPEDGDAEPVVTRDRWTDAPLYEKCQRRFASVSRDPDLLFPMLEMRLTVLREAITEAVKRCLLYTSPSPRDRTRSRMPSSA